MSPSYVCKRSSILSLPVEVLNAIKNNSIELSAAEELISIKDQKQRHRIANIVIRSRLSSRKTRQLVQSQYNSSSSSINHDLCIITDDFITYKDQIVNIDMKTQRSFDKTITALKIAMNKVATIIERVEENWIVYEILMQHKKMLDAQVALLIKQKKL